MLITDYNLKTKHMSGAFMLVFWKHVYEQVQH